MMKHRNTIVDAAIKEREKYYMALEFVQCLKAYQEDAETSVVIEGIEDVQVTFCDIYLLYVICGLHDGWRFEYSLWSRFGISLEVTTDDDIEFTLPRWSYCARMKYYEE